VRRGGGGGGGGGRAGGFVLYPGMFKYIVINWNSNVKKGTLWSHSRG
jgi:hypothetical protein